MTATEKLERIKLRCQQLLAIAEKRTKGKWEPDGLSGTQRGIFSPFPKPNKAGYEGAHIVLPGHSYLGDSDATFISACAGPAEAGWRSTIAAVDEILPYLLESDAAPGAVNSGSKFMLTQRAKTILAAWPEELL